MIRRASNIDANQPQIVKYLRIAGATIQHLHSVADGCPDLLVGFRGRNYLLEVKDGDKVPSKQSLTKDQERWHGEWRGEVFIVRSVYDALKAIGAMK